MSEPAMFTSHLPVFSAANSTTGRPIKPQPKAATLEVTQAEQDWQALVGWCWWLAGLILCFSVGSWGLMKGVGRDLKLLSLEPRPVIAQLGAEGLAEMVDVMPAGDAAPLEEAAAETPTEMELQEDTAEPVMTEELPEALHTEDVFDVPAAIELEPLVKLQAPPEKEFKKKPEPKPKKAAIASSQNSRAPKPSTATSGRQTAAGGTGTGSSAGLGQGGKGAGSGGRGRFSYPKPPYPAALKSRGVQGSVRLMITVGPSGRASSVSVSKTSGNSALDQYAASWVRRTGKGPPPGAAYTVAASMVFKLN
jgi:TonB family protein